MKLTRTTSSKNHKMIAQLEVSMLRDGVSTVLSAANELPEETAPTCPHKLHSFLVLASYETLWNKAHAADSSELIQLDYN